MEDLLDLDWSAPTNGTKQQPPLQPEPLKSTNTSFDFLSLPKASTGQANYYASPSLRPTSPNTAPIPQHARFAVPLRPSSGLSTPVQSAGDAFSNLLSLFGSTPLPGPSESISKPMSLAERQKQLAEAKQKQAEHDKKQFELWETLGTGTGARNTPVLKSAPFDDVLKPISRPMSAMGEPEILGPVPARNTQAKSIGGTFWENNDFLPSRPASNPPAVSTGNNSSQPADPFGFDSVSSSVSQAGPSRSQGGSGMRTPISNFDFGDGGDDEDDLLGELGKPAKAKPDLVAGEPTSSRAGPSRRQPISSRPTSPPPHIVGQIVEMGFTPAQARSALAKTTSGHDVEAALELLLGGTKPRHEDGFSEEDDDRIERERMRREEEEKERRRRRRAGPSRESVKARTDEEQRNGGVTPDPLAEQADRIYAQASLLGQSALSKATSFWNSSKEKALKAYEEQRKVLEAGEAKKPVKDGRPRWMAEAADEEEAGEEKELGGFRDDMTPPKPSRNGDGPSRSAQAGPSRSQGKDEYRSSKEKADLLFAEEPRVYKPASRHRKPAEQSLAPSRPARTPSPAPLPARKFVDATRAQIDSSGLAKTKGNEHFKLGRFTEAEIAYSSAINALPAVHILLIPLHNNRAAARLKLGESGSAAEDCSSVIELVGPAYHPSKEAPLPVDLAREVRLADAMVKALIKRAQAWEMGEKYQKAVEDWEKLMSFDIVMLGTSATSTENLAAEGARRARKMLEAGQVAKPAPAPRPATKFPPNKPVNTDKSAAVSELRKANQAAETESAARTAFKDTVDAKLLSWKSGKETNLRALIASLDTVLWDEILAGGLKVGMHELIMDKQVKIKYMKVIARLHPDKLNLSDTTVEQRMLANGAFGTLSDAWQIFSNP